MRGRRSPFDTEKRTSRSKSEQTSHKDENVHMRDVGVKKDRNGHQDDADCVDETTAELV